MASIHWRKAENEAGYPYFVKADTNTEQYDHPEFSQIMEGMDIFKSIKYSVYRMAYKLYSLHKSFKVPPVVITMGVFSRHCLSISESSLTLEACELEAVLTDIYFAASKEGLFVGDIDKTADLMLNFILNLFDKERNTPIRVQSAKTVLLLLSSCPWRERWRALLGAVADHNGCVSARRLSSLLQQVATLVQGVGEVELGTQLVQSEVDRCFAKTPGMLGLSEFQLMQWVDCSPPPALLSWLPVTERIMAREKPQKLAWTCASCRSDYTQGLRFKCSSCFNVVLCELCYLYEGKMKHIRSHKQSHLVRELLAEEDPPSECMGGFLRNFKRLIFCNSVFKSNSDSVTGLVDVNKLSCNSSSRPAMVTSTVGKVAGRVMVPSPVVVLQDIIAQLEAQNRALESLSRGLCVDTLHRVAEHRALVAAQIDRLKILQEGLQTSDEHGSQCGPKTNQRTTDAKLQSFHMFSPILQQQQPNKHQTNKLQSQTMQMQPRVLSLDSGNFSEHELLESSASKSSATELMTVSGDMMKPILVHAPSDSISTVSMNDISTWFNSESNSKKTGRLSSRGTNNSSISEQRVRYNAGVQRCSAENQTAGDLKGELDCVLDRLQQIVAHNFVVDECLFDNNQLAQTANEMESLLGRLIRGVEQIQSAPPISTDKIYLV